MCIRDSPGNFIFRTREFEQMEMEFFVVPGTDEEWHQYWICLLYTSDAADERSSVDLGGRRIIKKKNRDDT